jgi:hypothetical protein
VAVWIIEEMNREGRKRVFDILTPVRAVWGQGVVSVHCLSSGGMRMVRELMKRLQCLALRHRVAAADEVEMDDEAFEKLFVYPEAETERERAEEGKA